MTKQDLATIPVAGFAIAWPRVHEFVQWMATEAQIILPLLGALWLVVQIIAKIYSTWWKK